MQQTVAFSKAYNKEKCRYTLFNVPTLYLISHIIKDKLQNGQIKAY